MHLQAQDSVHLQTRINEFFLLQGHGQDEYNSSPKSEEEASECFMGDLSFGTAGLRSEMDVGFNRMNEVTVRIAAMGIGRYLKEKYPDGTVVVIGYDHRHNSKLFALSSAQVYQSYGHKIRLFPSLVPTPFVPSALQCFKGQMGLGVMVTASHNPKNDNGYKVYGDNGAQILDLVAKDISFFIREERGKYDEIKRKKGFEINEADSKELMERVTTWYIEKLKGFLNNSLVNVPRVVYTPLHGVGGEYIDRIFSSIFGSEILSLSICHVQEQRFPDPNFPTVRFPNPEEGSSTLELAMKTAEREEIRVVFANDPDADRFCVAEKDPSSGKWRIFNGNEIATLLADFIASKIEAEGETETTEKESFAMLASCVSSRFLKHFCDHRGWHFESTSTGFKNLGNRGLILRDQKSKKILFSYEEAIGFQVGDWNFDKDGISAMMTFYKLLAGLVDREGGGLAERLRDIYRNEGVWPIQFNGYYICKPASRIKTILKSVQNPDMTTETFSNDGNVIKLEYPQRGLWIMLRSSGTEPKLKFYSEMLGRDEFKAGEKAKFEKFVLGLIEKMIEPTKNGLKINN